MGDEVYGNQFSIEEMIANLLLNAIKYTPAHGTVTLNIIDQQKDIQVEILDTGIGIPESELEFVFDEFYRATNARKTERDAHRHGCGDAGDGASAAHLLARQHG